LRLVSAGCTEPFPGRFHLRVLPNASGANRDSSRLEGKADRVEWFKELAARLPPII
jgi:hypothetical protein